MVVGAVGVWQVLEANDRPLMFRLHQLGAAECHFAYRMVVVMMRRDLGMDKVGRQDSQQLGLHTCAARSTTMTALPACTAKCLLCCCTW